MTAPQGFRRACLLDEVPEPGARRVEYDDVDVAVVRTEGEVYAIEDVCSHAEVALSEGEIEGRTIECWMHGSCFDLCTGASTNPPATEPVDVFDVEVIDGVVYVSDTPSQTNGRPTCRIDSAQRYDHLAGKDSSVLKQREQATS